jgi:hypothetical protein
MRPVSVTVTGSPQASAVIVPDIHKSPFAIGAGVKVTGTITFQVQHTFDDVFSPTFDPATAVWYNHPTLTGSTNVDSNYAFAVRGIRITTSAGTGSATLTAVQAGPT